MLYSLVMPGSPGFGKSATRNANDVTKEALSGKGVGDYEKKSVSLVTINMPLVVDFDIPLFFAVDESLDCV